MAFEWIPVKWRNPTEEEKREQIEKYGEWFPMADFRAPEDGQDILVTATYFYKGERHTVVMADTVSNDGEMMGLEVNDDWEGILAWMPLPEPYQETQKGGNKT